jgi:hypothetical protein
MLNGVSAVTYEPIIRYAPFIVPMVLVAGIAAVTVYRPPAMANAPGIANALANGVRSPIACADASARIESTTGGSATDQAASQSCP